MRFKRNAFNYITWGLLCVILFAGVGISAISVSEANSSSTYLFYVAVFYGLFVVGCALLMVAYRLLRKVWKDKLAPKIKVNVLVETVLVFVVVIAAIVLRFVLTLMKLDDQNAISGTWVYYEYAVGNIASLGTASNIAYVFANILKGLFAVFSQTPIVVFVLQAFLTLGELLFIHYALKESCGRVVAWIALLLTAFLPGSMALFTQCTPGLFLVFLLSGYLFAAVKVIRGSLLGRYSHNKYLLLFGLLGLLTGAICYFDIFGVILLPLTIYAFFVFYSKNRIEAASKPVFQSLVYLATALVVLGVSLFGFPAGMEAGVTGIVRFGACFVPREGVNLTLLTPLFGTWDALLLYILAGFWILAFLKTKTDKAFAFSVAVIAMVAFQFFTFDHTDYIPLVSLAFAVIGAIGFGCLKFVFASDEALAAVEKEDEDAYKAMLDNARKRPGRKPLFGGSGVIMLGSDLHADLVAEDQELNKETEPDKTEEPATATEPEKAEEKIAVAESEKTEEPVIAAEPEKTEEPAIVAEPEKTEEPVIVAEPEKVEEPVVTAEPEKVEEPVVTAEPEKVEEPAVIAEPEKAEEPVAVAEPAKIDEPATATEPVQTTEPVSTEEAPQEEPKPEPAEEKKEERVLPPYVPQKMILRRRGKMFTPVKKSEEVAESDYTSVETVSPAVTASEPVNTVPAPAAVSAVTEELPAVSTAAVSGITEEIPAVAPAVEPAFTEETPAVSEDASVPVPAVSEEAPAPATTTEESVITEPVNAPEPENVQEPVNAQEPASVPEPSKVDQVMETAVPAAPVSIGNVARKKALPELPSLEANPEGNQELHSTIAPLTESVKEIKNPLPGPKPHVPRELVFDYDVKEDEWDFDLNDLGDKDDYDI